MPRNRVKITVQKCVDPAIIFDGDVPKMPGQDEPYKKCGFQEGQSWIVEKEMRMPEGFCGSAWLRPDAVTDVGAQTRISFAARGEWPAIFVKNPDGSESLANFHAEGTTAVVHRVAGGFVLRRGRLVGCVENRGYGGSGAWVASGVHGPGAMREIAQ